MKNSYEKIEKLHSLYKEYQVYYGVLGTLITYILVGNGIDSYYCYIEASCEHPVHRTLFLYKKLSREICIPFDNFRETIVLL